MVQTLTDVTEEEFKVLERRARGVFKRAFIGTETDQREQGDAVAESQRYGVAYDPDTNTVAVYDRRGRHVIPEGVIPKTGTLIPDKRLNSVLDSAIGMLGKELTAYRANTQATVGYRT